MKTALLWLRRDLRLADNPALHHALSHAERIVPVYIDSFEAPGTEPGAASRWWLHYSLTAFAADLQRHRAALVIRRGEPARVLSELAKQFGAEAAFWNRLYEPAQYQADRRICDGLIDAGLEVRTFNGALLAEPWEIETQTGGPYRVYTPFSRKLRARGTPRSPLPAPRRIPGVAAESLTIASLGLLPKIGWDAGIAKTWKPGEAGAQQRLTRFCDEALQDYSAGRDRPDQLLTSRLSPHLHFGEIGPVQLLARVQRELAENHGPGVAGGAETYEREILWREFAHHVLYHYPRTPSEPMDPRFSAFAWRKPREYAEDLRRWQQGRTGVPIVDAGMRQLWTTGWMHNRVRMIVASFLSKNLLIPWQEGAAWFWDTLVDADLPANTLGWQWVAGSGADAAPYFRIFNPVTQSQKFDPEGRYLRHWVPEIAALPASLLHAPWLAEPSVLAQLKIDYPAPSVDLGESRSRALQAFERIKRGRSGGPGRQVHDRAGVSA
ncbi:MAG: deoxyribodipyrimidine photolyase [Hydrocarboniphaga sp.]|uniref:cryptochrome/photolyase family protein n=1 Tax=Hydrocarboniphaga sp. TaxID=2033016 RepID=UPI002603E27F|nr:deoxyribodipyrimidine photo-lyase [Hydrocarboniphaga sp.]MDB5969597.1 deoxyribodipyrimidine photolyase [Hydrocarboniphaga sp.]